MSKKNVPQLLEKAKEQLKGKNVVSFIGESYCGKTVVSALLKFTIVQYFVPRSNGEFEALVTEGSTVVSSILKKMHSGSFPPHTLPYHKSPIMIDIYTTKGFGGKIELILRDMSGEDYEEYLTSEYDDPEDMITDIISEGKTEHDDFGPLSHLIFAKMYVILVDCSKFANWVQEQSDYALMMRNLRKLKEKAEETVDGKITAPIAIVFTKVDLLPEEQKKLAPTELMNLMPEFVSSLHICHKGPIEYFLMSVDVERASQQDIEQMNKDEHDDNILSEQVIQKRLNNAFLIAKKRAIDSGKDEPTATAEAEKSKEAELKKIEKEKTQFEETPYVQRFKLKTPLAYNTSEYIRFITWIIEQLISK